MEATTPEEPTTGEYAAALATQEEWIQRAKENREEASIAELFASACRRLARELDVGLVLQPDFTKYGPLHTNASYARGSIRLRGVLHESDEFRHMNAEYGAAVLREIIGRLGDRANDNDGRQLVTHET